VLGNRSDRLAMVQLPLSRNRFNIVALFMWCKTSGPGTLLPVTMFAQFGRDLDYQQNTYRA